MSQRCGRCKQDLPETAFSPSYRGLPGRWCRACFGAARRGEPAGKHVERKCVRCGQPYTPRQVKGYAVGFCSAACKQLARKESGRERDSYLQRTYGIGLADYDRMLSEQGGGCALCSVKPDELTVGRFRTYLHVDHCHETGKVRGLLCPDCNLLVGRRDPDWFRRAADYLRR